MHKKRILILVCSLFCVISIYSHYSQKVGLVLSGGGAKGAVHLGIIKALEENNIPIDYIAGTSIGAVVGSLYAIGYSPDEILDLFLSKDFYYWQTGKVEENYQYYFRKNPNDQPDFVKFNVPLRDSLSIRTTDFLPNSLVSPIQMNQAFLQLFSQANAQCDGNFDNLFVPFLCIASDVFNKEMIVFRKGDLAEAVRASMTFPLVFKPILKDSIPLFDGGIFDNFPVNPMKKAFNPDFIIGSSVVGNKKMKKPSDMDLYKLVESVIMQQTNYSIDPEEGIMMRFILEDVGLLDFNKSKTLYDIGYKAASELMDSIKGRVKRRVSLDELTEKRKNYKNSLPKLLFRKIYIKGVNSTQEQYIENQIHRDAQSNFTMDDFKKTYFRLLSNPKIQEIYPHAVWDSIDNIFDLYLDVQIRNEITIAFGGNISSMSANQLYLGVGYRSLTDFFSEIKLDMQVGNTYNGVALSGKIELPYSTLPLDISGVAAHNYRKFYESEKLFIDTDVSTFIHQRETYGKLGLGFPFQNKARMDIFWGYGSLEDKYYQNSKGPYYTDNFDRSVYNLFITGLLYRKNTQDAKQYPIKGHNHHVYAQYISGNENFYPALTKSKTSQYQSWIQLDAFLYNIHPISSKFNFGYMLNGVISSKNLLSNYTASVLQAPAYTPTLFSKIVFNEAFRANQFIAGGIIPIWKINSTIHLRGDLHGFLPVYPIRRGDNDKAYYSKLFTHSAYLGEVSLVAQLPFMSVSLFLNHCSYPKNNWYFGLNIGYMIFGPKFIP